MKRILVGGIGHESNTFTPFLTTFEDFHPRFGQETLAQTHRRSAFAGIVATLHPRDDITLVPSLTAHAMPGGVVERKTFETFKQTLLDAARDVDGGAKIDGACLYLHGAMRAEGIDYCENDILTALRAQLGPDVPITIALDMHANIVAETAHTVDAMVAYHTAPHEDAYATGVTAAHLLLHLLDGGQLAMGFTKIPFLLPGEKAQSAIGAMGDMMQRVAQLESQPGILSASLMNGHCWADVPDIGVSAVVVTPGDAALAQAEADHLAAEFWTRRADFGFSTEAYPVDEAVAVAMTAPESTVFLSDSGDNPGAGGTTDVTAVLESLLRQRAGCQTDGGAVVASIWDAAAVEACIVAGVGSQVSVEVGGKLDTRHGTPLPVTGTVRLIWDGDYYWGGRRDPRRLYKCGTTVVLTVDGVDVILTKERQSYVAPEQFHALGIDPLAYKIVVPKRGYLTAPLRAISPRSIMAISPGVTNCDVTQLDYRRVTRPMYPLDPDATWKPA